MCTTLDPLAVSEYATLQIETLRSAGLEIVFRSDFEALHALELPGKTLTPFFGPQYFFLHPGNGFWFDVRLNKRTVAIHAVKLQDHGDQGLATLWSHEFRLIYGPDGAQAPLVEAAAGMKGRSTYHGELWVADELRGKGIGPALAALGIAVAAIRFQPDRWYGFVTNSLTRSGYALREGFLAVLPFDREWPGATPYLNADDYMVYLTPAVASRMIERALKTGSYNQVRRQLRTVNERHIGSN